MGSTTMAGETGSAEPGWTDAETSDGSVNWSRVLPAGDITRERKGFFEWSPSRSLLASIRSYQYWRGKWYGAPLVKLAVLRHRFWSVVTAADIPLNCRLGVGLLIPYPTCIVIHPEAVIGPDCLIFSGVTIGSRGPGDVPVLGTHVDVGTGAKILGPVRIGDRAVIGANAVVMRDVRAGATVVGVPTDGDCL